MSATSVSSFSTATGAIVVGALAVGLGVVLPGDSSGLCVTVGACVGLRVTGIGVGMGVGLRVTGIGVGPGVVTRG